MENKCEKRLLPRLPPLLCDILDAIAVVRVHAKWSVGPERRYNSDVHKNFISKHVLLGDNIVLVGWISSSMLLKIRSVGFSVE